MLPLEFLKNASLPHDVVDIKTSTLASIALKCKDTTAALENCFCLTNDSVSIQAAELSASSLHENDLHALKSIASNLSINITGQKGFYNQRHMDDYLSPDLINQNVYVVRKIQETLDGLKSIALKN